ncbi:hypothetical protein OGAPHI_002912 [Ogataea philodendri]|uniref:Serine aminopeptidase S33 domain-containing protein n=1 Tax=Ogataea philodendri TaxID=1378263 RepID=A0A9P8T5Q9_9ASCO|nr:uncharacterized protein OGAPHI_002912 [Ogataea philodendri]KAH3667263.1 hypothetical protein OGAPHI_002912 [Ogataea philodendri]
MITNVSEYEPVFDIPYVLQARAKQFRVAYNKCEFRCITVEPPLDVKYKGRCLFVHGYRECSELHLRMMDSLALQGYACFVFDQRRNGLSKPLGLFDYTNDHYTFDDLEFFVSFNLAIDADNLCLVGHSMGGAIVLQYMTTGRHRHRVRNVVASSPLLVHRDNNCVWKFLVMLVLSYIPLLNLLTLQKTDVNVVRKQQVQQSRLREEDFRKVATRNRLTNDLSWLPAVNQIRLISKVGTIEEVIHILRRGMGLVDNAEQVGRRFAELDSCKFLICQTLQDPLADIGGVEKFVKGVPEVQLRWYEECKHALFIERQEVFEAVATDVVRFLNS